MAEQRTVFVVDDDEGARKSVCALVESMGLQTEAFASAEEFLDHYTDGRAGCLVTDLRMPGVSGVELQEHLAKRGISLPVIILTAHARTPITVRAVKTGAISVLDKPYMDDDLWDAIRAALAKDADDREKAKSEQVLRSRFQQLTPPEKDVLNLIIQGRSSKVIAKELDISVRTVANRRAEIFAKIGVTSVAELVRLATPNAVD
jgi:FixJ family two-component response regulator